MKKIVLGIALAAFVLFGVAEIQKSSASIINFENIVIDKDPDGKKDKKEKKCDKKSEGDKKGTESKCGDKKSKDKSCCKERVVKKSSCSKAPDKK